MLAIPTLQPIFAASQWERVDDQYAASVIERLEQDQIEVRVWEGYVYVYSAHPVNVRIFTILGQPVASEVIGPGGARIHIATRGIYILKAAGLTKRITI